NTASPHGRPCWASIRPANAPMPRMLRPCKRCNHWAAWPTRCAGSRNALFNAIIETTPAPIPSNKGIRMARRILFAVHDWGLGHASRSLLLIRALVDRGDHVSIVAAPGSGLQMLQSGLGDACRYITHTDIPKPFSRWPAMFY